MALNFPASPTNGDTFTDGTTTWEYDGTAWNVQTVSSASIPNSFAQINVAGQSSITADQKSDVLTLVQGSNVTITTDAASDSITFSSTAIGGGADQNIFETVAGDTGSTTANTTTDTLTIAGGTNITTSVSGDTLTIDYSGSTPSTTFNSLTDASTASLTIDKIYEPAIAILRVDNVGTSAYTFSSHYTGSNPTIYALAGTTLAFDLGQISGHPFEIQDGTLSAITTGLVHVATDGTVSTDASAQGKDSGTLYWRINESISGTYAYQCQNHASMVGQIVIKRLSVI